MSGFQKPDNSNFVGGFGSVFSTGTESRSAECQVFKNLTIPILWLSFGSAFSTSTESRSAECKVFKNLTIPILWVILGLLFLPAQSPDQLNVRFSKTLQFQFCG